MPATVPRCKHCWSVLRFITLASGKRLAVNPPRWPGGKTHAARKVGADYVDGVVLRHGDPIPPGYTGFRVHAADCKPSGAPTSRDRQSDFLPLGEPS